MRETPGRNHGVMDFVLYRKIIDDICQFEDRVKVIRLYKDGEPFLNPHFAEMVSYAKKSGCCDRVDTTTNAALLTPDLSLRVIDAGLDRINISVEGVNEEQYKDFSQYKINYRQFVDNIRFFYEHRKQCEMIVKINGDILTEGQKQEFYDIFGDITDGIFIESIMDCWPNFEQNKIPINQQRGIYGQPISEVLVCPYVFYSFAFNSDGTCSLCFLDWRRNLILGTAHSMTAKEIWENDKLKEYRRMFLRKERGTHSICANCGQLKQGQPDDIDAFAQELLERLN
jgi:MoaA/NifB/PqqE/SkfB family radical SAM enzyme